MNIKPLTIIIALALLITGGWFFLIANKQNDEDTRLATRLAETGELKIVTSFYPLQFALEQIVGDLGTVTNIGAGKDPHDYEPTVQDVRALQEATLVVLQGADFEPWGDQVQEQLEAAGVPVVLATAPLTLSEHEAWHHDEHDEHTEEAEAGHDQTHADEENAHEDDHGHEHKKDAREAWHHDEAKASDEHHDEHEHEATEHEHEEKTKPTEHKDEHADEHHHHGTHDPHTWLDPILFAETIAYLAEKLTVLDPENAERYQANAEALQARLSELDTQYENRLTGCALSEVITSHDAFGYVGKRYGFVIHPIAGLSTQDRPSVTVLAELRAEAEEGIGAILLEENNIAAYGQTLARETGLETLPIHTIAYAVPSEEDYLTLMSQNLDTFATALACE